MALRNRTIHGIALAAACLLVSASTAFAGPYTRLQVLVPGETAAPGTSNGKTGTPLNQTAGVPFTITVRACDDSWNTVGTVTNAVQILCSDASATLPSPAQLQSGQRTFTVTLNAGGSFTIFAHDQTDGTIPDGASAKVTSLVLQGFTFSTINQKNQTAGVPMTISMQAVDPAGHVVTGFSGSVALKEITSYGDGRISPATVTLSAGQWTGSVTMYRADETSINRGNVNVYAFLSAAPAKNGTSDPFTVHPGAFSRLQVIVPGQTPLPGSVAGFTGSTSSQSAGRAFNVDVYSTDAYWNPLPSGDNVRLTSSDAAASTPMTSLLTNGFHRFSVSLGTVGTQTLTASDMTNGSITPMTSAGIQVIPSNVDHFVIASIPSPQTAGVGVSVTIRAADATGNTVPGYNASAVLTANTGAGSITPEQVTFTDGVWTGTMVFKGAGGAVSFSCFDYSSPPHSGTSNNFTVNPGPFTGLQILLPGETAQGGTPSGKLGTPTDETAGNLFTITVRAVDDFWNLVPGVSDHVSLGSTDAFAPIPADTALANGQILIPGRLYRSGPQRVWVSDLTNGSIRPDTSGAVNVVGGPFKKVLILAPGESSAPGTVTGRTGTATDQSINYAFTVTVLATDQWWNPVTGPSDVVHVTSGDALAQLPADQAMVNGRADMNVRLSTGGFQQISVSDVTNAAIGGSTTQVRAISSGFHLEASVAPGSARAGEPFSLTVKVTNDAGSVIQEINSFVTVVVQNANSRTPGQGTLLTTQFQLLQGQRTVSETYTFAEPIVITAHDDAGNAPAVSNPITITPGVPAAIQLTANPPWVGGNKHDLLSARLVDAFDNGVPDQAMVFQRLTGNGTLTPVDSLTNANGVATADFLSARQPEFDQIHVSSGALTADLNLQTAFVDPNATGGSVTNYPNPFHPGSEPTTIAYVLSDNATVTLRIFTQSGQPVLKREFSTGAIGGMTGLNEFVWDGRNGDGTYVASGGYIALIEAQGKGETVNTMRRKIAVIR
ncbi:MAG TPA: FlgD immunoglobulin-like domain containing protein [Candidatus Eisenbacteria bacterium]|nr:FlgD immunoglobulin-like domain containing protein [Candidatus Eisenbacteria bacterium]